MSYVITFDIWESLYYELVLHHDYSASGQENYRKSKWLSLKELSEKHIMAMFPSSPSKD